MKIDYSTPNLAPEELVLDRTYALTINASKITSNFKGNVERYIEIVKLLMLHNTMINVYPELSRKGRLHYHGTITFTKLLGISNFYFQLYNLTDKVNVLIREIDDGNKWNAYCQKQRDVMEAACIHYAIKYVLNHNNLSLTKVQPVVTYKRKLLDSPSESLSSDEGGDPSGF